MAEKIWHLLTELDNQARYSQHLDNTAEELFGELYRDLHFTEQDEVKDELIKVLLSNDLN